MKTIFQKASADGLIDRMKLLKPDSPPAWGTMNAPQMVVHVSDQYRLALGELDAPEGTGFLTSGFMQVLALYVLPMPKAKLEAPPVTFTTEPADWEGDIAVLTELVFKHSHCDPKIEWPVHPIFGRLTGKKWGVLSYRHLDHHLKQFGV